MKKHDLIALYRSLFAGRPDVYAFLTEWTIKDANGEDQKKKAYIPSNYDGHKETTKERVRDTVQLVGSADYDDLAVEAHLYGRQFLGVYPLHKDSTVRFAALDFDGDSPEEAWMEAYRHYVTFRDEAKLPCYLEVSQSGNGYHLWFFFEENIDAHTVRRAVKQFINKSEWYDRMFPNQSRVSEHKPLGNLVALPLFGPKVREGKNTFVIPADEYTQDNDFDGVAAQSKRPIVVSDVTAFLQNVERISKARMEELAASAPEIPEETEVRVRDGVASGDIRGGSKLLDARFGCEWVRWMMECPEEVDEPNWYALACNLAQLSNGRDLFHQISALSVRYSPRDTDMKFDQAVEKNAPHTCEYTRENLSGPGCSCDKRFPGRVYHPFDLAKIPVFELMGGVEGDNVIESIHTGFEEAFLWAQEVEKDPTIGQGYPYGISSLDEYTGLRNSTLNIFAARPSIGKAQPLDAKILTPTGFVAMGTVQVGDAIIGRDGATHSVLGVYPQGPKDIYRVRFSDGTATECCDEHLWFTQTYRDKKNGFAGTVKSLKEIRETLRYGAENRGNHAVPMVAPVVFQSSPLGLHPYVLGVYLGDGTSHGTARIHCPEGDVRGKVASLLPADDTLVDEGEVTCRIRRRKRDNTPSQTLKFLEIAGLLGKRAEEKSIPMAYKMASVEDRIELLRGLFDTDGFVYGPGVEFSTSSPALAEDVVFLVRSLGGTATELDRIPTYSYKGESHEGQRAYRVFVQFPNGIIPVSSAKHLARWTPRQRVQHKWIEAIEYVGVKPAQCIKVSAPDSLYVTDDFIVTHNTAFALDVAYRAADSNIPVYFFSLEMSRKQLWRRLICRAAGVSLTKMVKGKLSKDDWKKFQTTMEELKARARFPLFVDDTTRDIRKIMDTAWNLKEEHGHGIVMIDYLGLLDWYKGENEYAGTTRNSKESKLLAKALDMPVFMLHQFNRQGDDMSVGADTFDSWLRSTGQIEQDADVILYLLGERGAGIKEREVVLQKDRDREAAHRVLLEFDPSQMRFYTAGSRFSLNNTLQLAPSVSVTEDDSNFSWEKP